MHVTGSSYAWFIFNLNTKSCYSQIIYYSVHIWDMAHINPTHCFLLPALFTCHPLFLLPAFFLTWRTSFLARGANTHPLLSLVCYQLFTLCYFSHPDTPHRSSYNIYMMTSTTSAILSDTLSDKMLPKKLKLKKFGLSTYPASRIHGLFIT
jgi:hypothetical protein